LPGVMMWDGAKLGVEGEKAAERFLRRKGYRIVTRNYRCLPFGEIDIVALDGSMIVFVEVKTRASRDHEDPESAVTPAKQERLIRTANVFLRQTRSVGRACRFDIVTITGVSGGVLEIEHFINAFAPRAWS
jgi:putative endonuclease